MTAFRPMLAHRWQDARPTIRLEAGVYVSPKLDGIRCIITASGARTRTGEPIHTIGHILAALRPLFRTNPGLILDGEIYRHGMAFEEIVSELSKPNNRRLELHVFDVPSHPGRFELRLVELKRVLGTIRSQWVKMVPHTLVTSESELEAQLQAAVADGFEGIMINLAGGLYHNKRSINLLKFKLFRDDEFAIESIGFGTATFTTPDGKSFGAQIRGSESRWAELQASESKLIGRLATVRFQELTKDGIPRFASFVGLRE